MNQTTPNKPGRYKIYGLILAIIMLIAAILCKYYVKSEISAGISLVFLSLGLWLIMLFDTLDYRTAGYEGFKKQLERARLIGGYLLAVLVSAATVIMIIF